MFEGNSADMCAGKFPLLSMGGRVEGLAWADPVARTPIGASGNFNLLPVNLRNSEHGDVAMFKNHLDIYLANIPDQPTVSGLSRGATSNSLLHQIPVYTLPW